MSHEQLELKQFEKHAIALYGRCGAFGLVVLATVFSVLASLAAALPLISQVANNATLAEIQDPKTYIHIVVIVPLFVAPLCTIVFASLLNRLNTAYDTVAQLSTTDPLTGSANRRGFMNTATQNTHTLRKADTCLVGMVDLDKFKLVNDTYGHQVGDEALTCVAARLSEEIADLGLVGRLGGDEFAFIALGSKDQLLTLQQRISSHCTKLKLSNDIAISCSIGMVTLNESEDVESALARADRQLYEIKTGQLSYLNAKAA